MAETFTYSQLFAGEVGKIIKVPVSNATINRGDILVGTVTSGAVASAFTKATAATVGNIYVVAAESVEDYTGDIVAYGEGYFDAGQVKIDDKAVTDAAKLALMASKIYVVETN